MQRFRGRLVFKAHRLFVSLNSRLESHTEAPISYGGEYSNAILVEKRSDLGRAGSGAVAALKLADQLCRVRRRRRCGSLSRRILTNESII